MQEKETYIQKSTEMQYTKNFREMEDAKYFVTKYPMHSTDLKRVCLYCTSDPRSMETARRISQKLYTAKKYDW